jgi:hypothetical protein
MKVLMTLFVLASCTDHSSTSYQPAATVPQTEAVPYRYQWLSGGIDPAHMLVNRVPAPAGFRRIHVDRPGFGHWLRHVPLKPGKPEVNLYNGKRKARQNVHHAVIDIDVGDKDLQQCADAVMRLRAEYLYETRQFDALHFNFTSGDVCAWNKWREGYRPTVSGNSVRWSKSASPSDSYANFRAYMEMVFNYAGTYSLRQELDPRDVVGIMPGDVFIEGGFPGHAVIVLDVAENEAGERLFLLAQSYMPAQDIHVLLALGQKFNPWYTIDFGETLRTPEWTFQRSDLRKF